MTDWTKRICCPKCGGSNISFVFDWHCWTTVSAWCCDCKDEKGRTDVYFIADEEHGWNLIPKEGEKDDEDY